MLGNDIFQNTRIASPHQRRLFLDGFKKQELDQVHPVVHDLVALWNYPHNDLFRAFSFTPLDNRPDSIYADVYESLYTLCDTSSEVLGAPGLAVGHGDHLAASPSVPQICSQGTTDNEDYVPLEDESESSHLAVETMQLGKRSHVYVLLSAAPMKKRQEEF